MQRWGNSDRGQASVEVIALIAVIAAVMVSAGAIAAVGAPRLLNAVTTNFQRALCVVSGQRCAALEREACPVLRTAEEHLLRTTVAIFNAGRGRSLLIERRSDGSYFLSLVEGGDFGLSLVAGQAGSSGEVASGIGGRIGRTYRVGSAAEARALAKQLRRPGLPTISTVIDGVRDLAGLKDADPSVESYVLAGRGGIDALTDLGVGGWLTATAAASHEHRVGVRIAAHRREATLFVDVTERGNAAFEAFAEVTAPLPRGRRRGKAAQDQQPESKDGEGGDGRVDLTKGREKPPAEPEPDRGPRRKVTVPNPYPLAAEARAVAKAHLAVTLGDGGNVLGVELVGSSTHGGKTRELRARLDPDAPGLGPALEALRRNPTNVEALRELGRAAAAGSALDRRTFSYRAAGGRHGGVAGRGAGLGLTLDGLRETSELIEQESRPPGGVWEPRLDC